LASDTKFCVVCSNSYPSELITCPDDGNMLMLEAGGGTRASRLGHVIGNYRLLAVLGEGGVGTVYAAEHVRLGRRVALKLLHPEVADNEVVTRFFNEARAVNEIRHPNIIDVEDFVTTPDGEHYMLMELLEGEDLREVMSREGKLEPERVSLIGQQIASALGAVHRVNIVHRDLKPDNVFVIQRDGKEVSKLLDFGVAKFMEDGTGLTRDGMTMGTPKYMAPEQIITGKEVGSSSDIYALGVLMYELLTGVAPFNGASIAAILRAHVSEAVVPPSQLRGEPLPAVLEAAVMKCLEKEVEDRFATADELADALRGEQPVELSGRFVTRAVETERQLRRAASEPPAASLRLPVAPRRRRVMQLIPAFAMAVAAAVIHFWPHAAPPTATAATVPVPPAPARPEAPAPTPRAPAEFRISLISKPVGAELFRGADREPLGTAPQTIVLPMSHEPVELIAKFADGREVTETIVPDAPRRELVFEKPRATEAPKKTTAPAPVTPVSSEPVPEPSVPEDRDSTLDPFK